MSRTKVTPFEERELDFRCRDCGAEPGHWCLSRNGRWASTLHAERYYDATRNAREANRGGVS